LAVAFQIPFFVPLHILDFTAALLIVKICVAKRRGTF